MDTILAGLSPTTIKSFIHQYSANCPSNETQVSLSSFQYPQIIMFHSPIIHFNGTMLTGLSITTIKSFIQAVLIVLTVNSGEPLIQAGCSMCTGLPCSICLVYILYSAVHTILQYSISSVYIMQYSSAVSTSSSIVTPSRPIRLQY